MPCQTYINELKIIKISYEIKFYYIFTTMVLTPTAQIPLGYYAPQFNLLNPVIDKKQSLDQLKSQKATVIIFMCNHCPYVVHILDILVQLSQDYLTKSISFIGINSNDILKYPDDSPEKMVELVKNNNIPFPYLFDETQDVARAYKAACTPDFSVFDANMKCVYRGQFDNSRPGNNQPVTGIDIKKVLDSILSGATIKTPQKPSLGCNIKWK
tara:strand:- start:672 stop:1307 length:636 start_codon:yes stop_codon:yes gene_type:complete